MMTLHSPEARSGLNRRKMPEISPLLPTVVLSAALVDSRWLGPDALRTAATVPGFSALARRANQDNTSTDISGAAPEPGAERWLREHFGLQDGCPVAACALLADDAPARWRIDPVHLHIGRDHLVLTDPARLSLTPDESHALCEAVAGLFNEEGLELTPTGNAHWALHETDPLRPLHLHTPSLSGALGRSIDARLPTGEDARRWRRLLNEVQMTWFAHPVNLERESSARPTVNSLWIEGPCPAIDPTSESRLMAAARLGARGRRTSHATDEGVPTPQAQPFKDAFITTHSGPLAVDDRLLEAVLEGDPQRWIDAWRALDTSLFTPMASGQSPWDRGARLVLAGDSGWRSLRIGARPDWRFWKRPDPSSWLHEIGTRAVSAT